MPASALCPPSSVFLPPYSSHHTGNVLPGSAVNVKSFPVPELSPTVIPVCSVNLYNATVSASGANVWAGVKLALYRTTLLNRTSDIAICNPAFVRVG
jgi:hypothetical protein